MRRMSKVPLKGSRGFYDATTEPEELQRMSERAPYANIALRTGQASRIMVVDEDREGAFAELERDIGSQPETWTVETPSGGRHLYYLLPDGEAVRGSASGGLDVRADDGYVVLPPSTTPEGEYRVATRTAMAQATPELIAWARNRRQPGGRSRDREAAGPSASRKAGDAKVPEGERFYYLRSVCGRLHDGTRDLEGLTEELITVRDTECENPETFEDWEVLKVAEMVHRMPPCRPRREQDPEVDEALERWSRRWYEELLRGEQEQEARRGEGRTRVRGQEVRSHHRGDRRRRTQGAAVQRLHAAAGGTL